MFTSSLGPSIPSLAEQTQTDLKAISTLFTCRYLGIMLGIYLGGRLYDRMPGHPFMAGMLLMAAVMMAFIPLLPDIRLLMLVVFVLGVGGGTLDVGGNTLLVWSHREKTSMYMNLLHFSYGLGAFISPILLAQSMNITGGVKSGYWMISLASLAPVVWLMRLPSPAPHMLDKETGAHRIKTHLVLLFVLFFLLYTGAEASIGGWIYTYAAKQGLASASASGFLTSAFWMSITVGRLIILPVSPRLAPDLLILICLGASLTSLFSISVVPSSPHILWFGIIATGLFISPIFPTTLGLAQKVIPTSGKITGWYLIGASFGAMFLPWLVGQFFESSGPRSMLWIILADMILVLTLFISLISRTRRHST